MSVALSVETEPMETEYDYYWADEYSDWDDEGLCTWCCGEGYQDNDDPLWYGFDVDAIPCRACNGTGLGKYQTIF